ncbi:TPR repeat-containing protein [Xenococcus sp. PCC 7305]|uniref:tetratricopeptide repeat-containing S1 family peptidase n=1 Tax=Xenococcus sp. PCC 7305 TaxID=102125 RepID=UPI0002AC85EC|nr:tetratricopeptide repeat-containing serine protease family protein [Xenococcus sp. PCC 7305]ELS00405.1 TPR repeat-containing protein [Xenococcus sp. PCC 7305]
MNRYLYFVPLLGIVTTIALQSQPLSALEPAEVSAKAQEFTVQIDGEETGTGTIIERNGNSYSVITCWHVMDTPGNYQVITPDGETYQVTEVKNLPDIDIAVITFTSGKTYSIAELGKSETINPGTNTYVVGYPNPFPGFPERAYLFSSAEIQSRLSKAEKGYKIIHNGSFTPGSSGGGIFDSEARLIGVNGRFISEGNTGKVYGAGIPLEIYLAERGNLFISTNITLPQDFVSLGRRKLKQKDYRGAIAEFNRALASNINDLDSLSGRGEAYLILKDYSMANKDFDAVLQRDPNNINALLYRGVTYMISEEKDKAIIDFSQAISINPDFGLAYLLRGTIYASRKEFDKAIADYQEPIRLGSDFAVASYSFLGMLHMNLEEYDKAIGYYTEAISFNPKITEIYLSRGLIYYRLEEYNKAIADCTKGISVDPSSADAYVLRGLSYNDLGDEKKAIDDFQKAADLYQKQGDTQLYQEAMDTIRDLQLYE